MAERTDCEHFIPIRKTDLIELLCGDPQLTPAQQAQFRQFCRLIEATFHFEYHGKLNELNDAYAMFDPDADTKPLATPQPAERERRIATLFDRFVELLERANFQRLSRDDLIAALAAASDWGLNLQVNFDVFDRLEVFARGDVVGRRSRRRLKNWNRLEEIELPVYQRLVLIFRLREQPKLGEKLDTQSVFIKLFKDIPKLDLEMLLPGTKVRLSLFDRGKIAMPVVSGIALAVWKLIKGAVVLAIAGVYSTLAFLGLVGGTIGYGIRSFFGYLRTKEKYQLSLTQSLYYQNLDNNGGALFRLLGEAEEQECREALLAYFFLWRHAGPAGWTEERLDDEVEAYLERAAGVKVDFEIGDALEKLERLKIIDEQPGGVLRAVSIRDALETLDRAWDNAFQYNAVEPPAASPAGPHWNRAAGSIVRS